MRSMNTLILIMIVSCSNLFAAGNQIKVFWETTGDRLLVYEGTGKNIADKMKDLKKLESKELEKSCDTVGSFIVEKDGVEYHVSNNYWISKNNEFYRCSIMNEAKEYLLKYFVKQYRASQRKV